MGQEGQHEQDAGAKQSAGVNKDLGNLYSPAESEVLRKERKQLAGKGHNGGEMSLVSYIC